MPLKAGIVGMGLGRHHLTAYAESCHVDHIVLCDLDPARLETYKAQVPKVKAVYKSLEEMLQREKPDLMSVTTPDHLHRPHAEACLAAGCHVLLTKPLATNIEDGRAIVRAGEAAAARGQKLGMAHERRFRPFFVKIKEMLDSGELGEVIHIRSDSIQDKREQFRRAPWYASPEAGRSALVGSGIHQVDVVRFLVGRPVAGAFGYGNRLGGMTFPADKTTSALFRFEGGAIASVTVTYEAHWPKAGAIEDIFRMVTTKGVIVGNQVSVDGRDEWRTIPKDDNPIPESSRVLTHRFIDAVVENRAVDVPVYEGFLSLAAAVAADRSGVEGRELAPEAL
jgi:predicted dehydrogenase